ncbi:hypothetical protein CPAST_c12200 [Clostridium pasteurianum DSM 525 = ATCC 6013]|uniref:Uncharacterized protein n=1 Tax=Clostridium pasteurianum DSM 525 = ATCC 6013 TaxID=1262449 RepID=A0A0H3J8E5_CLOPA|nr:hypothetical protein [Clostridium pasteurianum]AJA47320.1 hypothetical protein CPAST_c12200 [Clostridium pasteurianum DSM 525 = ATCC 6013]AJA51308.1 hypothetical protein CLPA_c12200 [Clostridium pasteurianum DSM 525 = ATCC 6013]AOZ74657.1 hypothetical protein AQ983_05895 [Clostridium pasteurianum DSM 525 = ATCC 6013]AOZ78454.1 hypothetical protein AQ984_05885 [Clostridium pasteurianum]ELP58657.1 hypothetical protein F502_12778 [Clostridium pasteurianum DSM 525 = ATCC 6013]
MGFFSRLFGRGDSSHRGSGYYKRQGFFDRILNMVGSGSHSGRRYDNRYHDSDRRRHYNHYSDDSYRDNYHDRNYRRKKYRSSWS